MKSHIGYAPKSFGCIRNPKRSSFSEVATNREVPTPIGNIMLLRRHRDLWMTCKERVYCFLGVLITATVAAAVNELGGEWRSMEGDGKREGVNGDRKSRGK